MNFNVAEKAEGFWGFSQNWFDVLTLVLTVLSLQLAFYLGERVYKRDKKDKIKEQKQLTDTEVKLFKVNLEELLKIINKQLKVYLNNYLASIEYQNYFNIIQILYVKYNFI